MGKSEPVMKTSDSDLRPEWPGNASQVKGPSIYLDT